MRDKNTFIMNEIIKNLAELLWQNEKNNNSEIDLGMAGLRLPSIEVGDYDENYYLSLTIDDIQYDIEITRARALSGVELYVKDITLEELEEFSECYPELWEQARLELQESGCESSFGINDFTCGYIGARFGR